MGPSLLSLGFFSCKTKYMPLSQVGRRDGKDTGLELKPTKGTLLWGSNTSSVPSVLTQEPVIWVMPAEPQ